MQHTSGCAAMPCINCKVHFCLWCRTVFPGKEKNATAIAHTHIWTCGKKPQLEYLITETAMFPANDDDPDFVDCYMNTRKLAVLAQTVCGQWSAADCRRLVLDEKFQSFLVHLKERQVSMPQLQ